MKFTHIGLFISVLILLGMLITCHLRNYMRSNTSPKSDFINLAIPTGTPPMRYNQISYNDQRQKKIPCEIAAQANVPCSQIQTPCPAQSISDQLSQLSDSELAIIYKLAYEQAGLELMNRVVNI